MTLIRSLQSEITKLRTTSIWWVLGIVLFGYVALTSAGLAFALGGAATGTIPSDGASLPPNLVPPMTYSLASAIGFVFPLLLGTLLVTGEYRHKTLTPTFLATPRRATALTAKALAGVLFAALYAIVAIVASVGAGALVLGLTGIDTQLGESDTWAMLARIVLAFALWALVGVGVGTLVRNQVAAIVIVLAFTQFLEPILRMVGSFVSGLTGVTQYLPGAASDALVGASIFNLASYFTGGGGLEWWQGGLVLLAFAVVATIAGYFASWRRDVS